MAIISAGLLMYRLKGNEPEIFLVHPGGPFFKNKDEGAWSIPKGLVEENETIQEAAIREFEEETGIKPSGPYLELGMVKMKSGKLIHAWSFLTTLEKPIIKSNTFEIEWPSHSGKLVEFPEVDSAEFFSFETALFKINDSQKTFLLRLQSQII